jgi:hypothetical protein
MKMPENHTLQWTGPASRVLVKVDRRGAGD